MCASSSEGRESAQQQLAILQAELHDVQGQQEAAVAARDQLAQALAENDQVLSQMWFERNMYRCGARRAGCRGTWAEMEQLDAAQRPSGASGSDLLWHVAGTRGCPACA